MKVKNLIETLKKVDENLNVAVNISDDRKGTDTVIYVADNNTLHIEVSGKLCWIIGHIMIEGQIN